MNVPLSKNLCKPWIFKFNVLQFTWKYYRRKKNLSKLKDDYFLGLFASKIIIANRLSSNSIFKTRFLFHFFTFFVKLWKWSPPSIFCIRNGRILFSYKDAGAYLYNLLKAYTRVLIRLNYSNYWIKSQNKLLLSTFYTPLENLDNAPFIQNSLSWVVIRSVCVPAGATTFHLVWWPWGAGMIVKELSRGACRRNEARSRFAFLRQLRRRKNGKRRARGEKWVAGGCRANFPKEAPPLDPPAAFYKVDPVGFQPPPAYLVFIWNMLRRREPFVFCCSRDEMSVGRLGNAEHKKSRRPRARESADFYQFNIQAERGST